MSIKDYPGNSTARMLRYNQNSNAIRWRKGTLDPSPLKGVVDWQRYEYKDGFDKEEFRFVPRMGFLQREDEYKS